MKTSKIYLDNAATTKVDEKVLKVMQNYMTKQYGNPSSLHNLGLTAKEAVENARKIIADAINAKPNEIIFTSGGTESNNLALKGIVAANKNKNHIITTKIEHKSILNVCKELEKSGVKITYLNVDDNGFVNLNELASAITTDTLLVSIIHGHNEIGTIQNISEIGKICRKYNVLFHADACQSFTKTESNVVKHNIDLMTLNAHKIHGPKGIGALYVREGVKINSIIQGGGQENNIRSGTENVPAIAGFAEAVKTKINPAQTNKISKLRDKLIKEILKIPGTRLNGPIGNKRLCNNANISFKGVEGEAIGELLNEKGVCSSTGSACSERSLETSYVLRAIGRSHEESNGSLRLSLSKYTSEKEIKYVLKILPEIIKRLRSISPYGKL